MSRQDFGTRQVFLVELDLDWVLNPPGPWNSDGSPCYRTPSTSLVEPLLGGFRTRRYCTSNAKGVWNLDAIPCVSSVRVETAKLTIGESLGSFGQVTITFDDFADDDRQEDPYISARESMAAGSYFARLAARNPYMQGRALRVQSEDETRHYLIRSFRRTDRSTWEIVGVSPLQLLNLRNAKAPKATGWTLAMPLDPSATIATLEYAEEMEPLAGSLRIGDELCLFGRSGTTLTLTRGQHGTEADSHDAGDAVQPVLVFADATVPEILRTLLVEHAGVDPAFIPIADWNSEAATWLTQYRLTPKPLTESVSVIELVNELCEQVGIFLWYDERTRSIRLQAIRPVPFDKVRKFTDDDLMSEVAIDPDMADRVSRVVALYAKRSALGKGDEQADYRCRLIGPAFGEGKYEHGSEATRELRSRWFTEADDALMARAAFTIANQLQNGRILLRFTLNKRDADLDLGQVVRLTTRDLVDAAGSPLPTFSIVIARSPSPDGVSAEYTAEQYPFVVRYAYVLANEHTQNYGQTPETLRDPGWFLSNPDGSLPGGDPPYALS